MKFALAFTALASAANNQAPVISLNLNSNTYLQSSQNAPQTRRNAFHTSGHNTAEAGNNFADECAVSQNLLAGAGCSEPVASAVDHHGGTVSVTTTWTLYVRSDAKKIPETANQEKTGIEWTQRGEWIITYDAKDASLNKAETLTFAMILNDEVEPECPPSGSSGKTPACYSGPDGDGGVEYRNYDGSSTLTIELCNGSGSNGLDTIYWAPVSQTSSFDKYDGQLTDANSNDFASYLCTDVNCGTEVDHSSAEVPSAEYTGLTATKTLGYQIISEDFAGVFGTGNTNNVRTETGKVILQDTNDPVIVKPANPNLWECGYHPTILPASYVDCYDDWNERQDSSSTWKNHVIIHIQNSNRHSSCKSPAGCEFGNGGIIAADGGIIVDTNNLKSNMFKHQNVRNNAFGLSGPVESTTSSQVDADKVTLHYTVSDKFGNPAAAVSHDLHIVDSLAPTLYITKAEYADTQTNNTHLDECIYGINSEVPISYNGSNTYATEHCKAFTQNGGFSTLKNSTNTLTSATNLYAAEHTDASVYSDMANQVTIYHSAGFSADYKAIASLMEEGKGYQCHDACSITTTTVQWQDDCADAQSGNNFNMKVVGTYFLKYTCVDAAGHSTTACRTFINEDKTRPIITVLDAANRNDGSYVIEGSRDNNYVDAGATCTDMVDGVLSDKVQVSGDVVNYASVGTYKITYNCKDSSEQTAIPAIRTVVVVDTTCPTCDIGQAVASEVTEPTVGRKNTYHLRSHLPDSGYGRMNNKTGYTTTIEASFPYDDGPTTCTDTLDSTLAVVREGAVDVETTGTYVLTYSATDLSGNGKNPSCSTELKTVIVRDTMVPVISLSYKGSALMAESTSSASGWVIGAVASAVSGVALLGYAATRKAAVATSVPV